MVKKRDYEKIVYIAFLAVLIAAILSVILFRGISFIIKDKAFLSQDEFMYYELSIFSHYKIFDKALLFEPTGTINHKPPLIYITTSLFYIFFPISQDVPLFANLFFIILIILIMILLEYKIKGDFKLGIYSPFIFALIPIWLIYPVRYYFPYISLTFCFFSVLLIAQHWKSKYFPWLMGFIIGLGMISHISFFVFILVPMIFCLKDCLNKIGFKKTLIKFMIIALVCGVICSFWFLPFFKDIIEVYSSNIFGSEVVENENISEIFSLKHFAFYVNNYYENIPSFIFISFLIISIIAVFYRNRFREINRISLYFIFPFLLFSIFIFRKDERYLLPLMPLIALSISIFLGRFSSKHYRYFIFAFLIAVLAFKSVIITYNQIDGDAQINPVESRINSLIQSEHPKSIVLYSFYVNLFNNFREQRILNNIDANMTDCVFTDKPGEECRLKQGSSVIFFSPNATCGDQNIQYERRFCKNYLETKDYFIKYYSNSTQIGKFLVWDKGRNVTIIVYRT